MVFFTNLSTVVVDAFFDIFILGNLSKDTILKRQEVYCMNMQNTSETDPPIGTNLIKAKVKTLPNGPGVYRMLGSNDDVLYVGKAKNLKNRVSSYTRIGVTPTVSQI